MHSESRPAIYTPSLDQLTMAPYCVLAVGPEDRVCGIEDFTEALNTARLTIMPGLRVVSASKAVEAVQAFNVSIRRTFVSEFS